HKTYHPDVEAVKSVSFEIQPGEFVSIVGRSGAGKTTLVRMLIAEEKPTKGSITIGDCDVVNMKNREIPMLRRQMGVVFQDFKLLPKKTVFENVSFALEVCGEKHSRICDVVPQVLKIVGLEDKEGRYPMQLSGGEKQRVGIARALVHRPKILLADEPTGNLDSITTKEIIDLLRKINKFGTTLILVTHDRETVNYLHERVIVLGNGQIISDQVGGKYIL
ncbi:MAG: ATP-binding cassette domain-containing protein, partial [Patescibacteria group bacterium]|nr:ATP-binding cassette domain-containing protein [Patescibacteria group bacterium]